jgi:hypothetical protein
MGYWAALIALAALALGVGVRRRAR